MINKPPCSHRRESLCLQFQQGESLSWWEGMVGGSQSRQLRGHFKHPKERGRTSWKGGSPPPVMCFLQWSHLLNDPWPSPNSTTKWPSVPMLEPMQEHLSKPPHPWNPICAPHILMGMEPSTGATKAIPLRKTDSPSTSSLQLSTSFQLRVRAHEPISPPSWNIDWLDLTHVCGGNHSCCDFMRTAVLSCPKDTASLWSSPTSVSYNLSAPSSVKVPETWGGWWCMDVPSVGEHSTLILCTLTSCVLLCQPPSMKLLWWSLYYPWFLSGEAKGPYTADLQLIYQIFLSHTATSQAPNEPCQGHLNSTLH